ncbi:MAG: hypothetical protein JO149_07200 [Gammaproteobacteria bacterium]|nr:hypothetical protein [Gammaproteobacteria bacterium]
MNNSTRKQFRCGQLSNNGNLIEIEYFETQSQANDNAKTRFLKSCHLSFRVEKIAFLGTPEEDDDWALVNAYQAGSITMSSDDIKTKP